MRLVVVAIRAHRVAVVIRVIIPLLCLRGRWVRVVTAGGGGGARGGAASRAAADNEYTVADCTLLHVQAIQVYSSLIR